MNPSISPQRTRALTAAFAAAFVLGALQPAEARPPRSGGSDKPESILGIYEATHPQWKSNLTLAADGTYRLANNESGTWVFDGATLLIRPRRGPSETLDYVSSGRFVASSNGFTLTRGLTSIAGTYDGVHPHWRDTVVLAADGTYRRGNGDPGRWTYDGKTLVLAWQNWGPETLEPVSPGSFRARSNGFTLTARAAVAATPEPVVEAPPVQRPALPNLRRPRDCGTGADDAGCQELKDGKAPMDADEFNGMMKALSGIRNELTRRDMVFQLLDKTPVTAHQFGRVIGLFSNELNRLQVVRERADRMVDPKRALGFASTFRNGLNAKEYTKIISGLE